MKNLRKIIFLFLVIFIAGVVITAVNINATLNKKTPTENLQTKKDTLLLIKAQKKIA